MRGLLLPIILLGLPLAEIAGFVAVGSRIGVLATVGLVITSSIVGLLLLRMQGFGAMARIAKEAKAGRDPSRELAHGVMIMLAGILLLIPGFLTDIIGLLLFLPPVRDLGWKFLRKRVNFSSGSAGSLGPFSRRFRSGGKTIDLDQDDYGEPGTPHPPARKLRRLDED